MYRSAMESDLSQNTDNVANESFAVRIGRNGRDLTLYDKESNAKC